MVRRKEQLFFGIVLGFDVATLFAIFMVAHWLRGHLLGSEYGLIPPLVEYLWAIWIIIPVFIAVQAGCGLYQSATYQNASLIVWYALIATLLGSVLAVALLYMMKRPEVSRLVLNIFSLLCVAMLPAEKLAVNALLQRAARHRRKQRRWRVLLIGEHDDAQKYLQVLDAHPYWGIVVTDIVSPTKEVTLAYASAAGGSADHIMTVPVDWREVLKGSVFDEVVAVSPWSQMASLSDVQEACVERGLIFRIMVTMPRPPLGRYNVDDCGEGSYLVSLETIPQAVLPLMAKRGIDIALSLIGLVLCGLVYLIYAPLLRRESDGPVLFKQERGGLNGRIFTIYKFRTMHVDAEKHLRQLLERNRVKGVMFKMENDPRVVSSGRFLRRTHLDELPQFWNVLKGDMSLVGPRPNPAREVADYGYHHYRRLSMKPGLTGLFQLKGHAAVPDFEEVVKLDCAYIDNWSLWLDCKIIVKTLLKLVRGSGW